MTNPAIIARKKGALEMSDYEVKNRVQTSRHNEKTIPGASPQLVEDLRGAAYEGVSYGTYMWRKYEKQHQAFYDKYKRKHQHS